MAIYGYVRRRQPLPTNDQLKIVSDYHCEELFIESANLKKHDAFDQLLTKLQPKDRVIIASLQVFGNDAVSTSRALAQLRQKEVQVISWSTQLHLNYYKRTAGLL
ncbi:recombinase family protein [Vagococcus sp. BWB3-3]|uniref:Recombinase family protein n=1 Tax=Vagococcus allomyrinae TaxID=2794353 RepID=A0A940P8Y4_9ENTE|nr:recombinase family protein [Vagococcus allomyrinae]MBP1040127.1 recombinase family protein [Vagococcus allomyrinae]